MTRRQPHHSVSPAGRVPAPPCTVVIFGAAGDLTKRLLMPALYDLAEARLLDPRMRIIGVDHNASTARGWAQSLGRTIRSFVRDKTAEFHSRIDPRAWSWLAERLDYLTGDFDQAATFTELARRLTPKGDPGGSVIFYLAVSARFFGPIVEQLAKTGLLTEPPGFFRRVVIEKPFGSDLATARALNHKLLRAMAEDQIYRIDHFLGKEATQNIHVLRFANGLFAGTWNNTHIGSVQIDVPETLDVAMRASFYESTGAILDMLVTHLFQVAGEVAMESPHCLEPDCLAEERERVIGCFRPLTRSDVVVGQYEGYRDIAGVAPDSRTETFVAARLWVDNDRWRGVPFLLRTGKCLAESHQRVSVLFKDPVEGLPGQPLGASVLGFELSGDGDIQLSLVVKEPGPSMTLGTSTVTIPLGTGFHTPALPAYSRLLHDVLMGDRSLFTRPDGLAHVWTVAAGILGDKPEPIPYAKGSWGPAEAAELAKPGAWHLGE